MSKIFVLAIAAVSFMGVFAGPTLGAKPAAKPVAVKPAVVKPTSAKPVAAKPVAAKPGVDNKAKPASRQCKGVTLDGQRCKHAALEGKDFCQQHADQALRTRCKAMTAEGKQCLRKASPHGFFCAQHEATKKLPDPKKDIGQCRAFTEDGKQCARKAAPGWKYCDQHRK